MQAGWELWESLVGAPAHPVGAPQTLHEGIPQLGAPTRTGLLRGTGPAPCHLWASVTPCTSRGGCSCCSQVLTAGMGCTSQGFPRPRMICGSLVTWKPLEHFSECSLNCQGQHSLCPCVHVFTHLCPLVPAVPRSPERPMGTQGFSLGLCCCPCVLPSCPGKQK